MNFESKNDQLRSIIYRELLPLIDNDYVLYDIPLHNNIGDLLIWEGELSFLKDVPYKMIDSCSIDTYKNKRINSNTIILLHGGGNFGDIWRKHQDFRLKIIQSYPNNKIVILPQTVYYEDKNQLLRDAQFMNLHKHLTICARDNVSFKILLQYFKCNILLLPDMAFCISTEKLVSKVLPQQNKILYLKRTDKELKNQTVQIPDLNEDYLEMRDWPSIERMDVIQLGLRVLQKIHIAKFTIWYADNIYKTFLINKGVKFISQYKNVYTTRLHVSILSTLLHKRNNIIDNSYGKNKNFYETWLADVDKIQLVSSTSNKF